jgi:hypothetical protein
MPDLRQQRSHASDGDVHREDLTKELKPTGNTLYALAIRDTGSQFSRSCRRQQAAAANTNR